ncbi:MAG: GWxTD domain-containing protein [Crocinitomicaceae bacterium]|nr:GWxTD domain-containing protein [Crocinitomicaceae bacterium]MDG1777600.1 GWxTD domain-containing protein [Crocinitomicaceae bacterium]
MKHLFLLLVTLSFTAQANAGNNAYTKNLRAYVDSKQFYAPGIGNYIEFQLQFVGYSLNYIKSESGLSAEVVVEMEVSQGSRIIASDAYRLSSPLITDSIIDDFYDIKRFVLKPGGYTFKIKLRDLNSENESLESSQTIVIEELGDAISISDIQIAETASKTTNESSVFYKSGYEMIPHLSTFYPKELSAIPVYFELYNTSQLEDSVFAIKQTLIHADTEQEFENLTVFSKHDAVAVVPFLRVIDISEVPTGKYILQFTVLNKNMRELCFQSYEFERSNSIEISTYTGDIVLDPSFQNSMSNDSVGFYLESLIPISKGVEVKNIIDIANRRSVEDARKYLQLYWSKTAPKTTYDTWIKYKQQVDFVEKLYATTIQPGYETDRGRVYLQYGAPSDVIRKEYSATEYPYEIWNYNKIGAFSNKRFVFYNPSMVNNSYRLLHSDMVGELKNLNWPAEVSKSGTINNPNSGGDFGGSSGRDY